MNLSKTTKSGLNKLLFILPMTFALSANVQALTLTSNTQIDQISLNTEDSVYSIVDKMPEFPGADKALVSFLNQTIIYPADALKKKEQGKVIVQFVVNNTGKVENAKVLRSISPSLDKEALRVIGLLPDWIPGEQNGVKVAVSRIVPVVFYIPTEEEAWVVNEKTLIVIDEVKMPAKFNTKILNPGKLTSVKVLKPFPKEEKARLIDLYGRTAANGVVLITSNKDEMYYALADTVADATVNEGCKVAAVSPEFPGGKVSLTTYIADSIQYPFVPKQLKTQGKVVVRFLVDKTGKVMDAKVMKSLDYYLDKEALRVINSMPDWTPGFKCDLKLNIFVTMPVTFKIDLPAAEKGWEKNDKTIVLLDGERLPASFDLAWLNYGDLSSYKVLQPSTKEVNKKLVSEYGKDAVNGVILISSIK